MWPEATKQFNAYYGPAAPSLYSYTDPDGNKTVRVTFSTEGTRAGCVVGSAGFDIALHHFVYKHLMAEYPAFVIRALTDDLPAFFKADTEDGWHAAYERMADFLTRYSELANPIGIYSHPDKGKLILPPDAPQPHAGSRLLSLTSLAPDGLAITGGFFGLPTAVTQHGLDKVVSLQPRIDGIVSLALAKNTQAAMKLLGECAAHAFDYFARITPPSLAAPALEAWDGVIEKARHDILQLEDHADPGLPERIRLRSSALAQPPTKLGGFG